MLPSDQGKEAVMQSNSRSSVLSFKERNLCLRPKTFLLNIQLGTEKKKLEYRLGHRLFGNNLGKKRNKFKKTSIAMQE